MMKNQSYNQVSGNSLSGFRQGKNSGMNSINQLASASSGKQAASTNEVKVPNHIRQAKDQSSEEAYGFQGRPDELNRAQANYLRGNSPSSDGFLNDPDSIHYEGNHGQVFEFQDYSNPFGGPQHQTPVPSTQRRQKSNSRNRNNGQREVSPPVRQAHSKTQQRLPTKRRTNNLQLTHDQVAGMSIDEIIAAAGNTSTNKNQRLNQTLQAPLPPQRQRKAYQRTQSPYYEEGPNSPINIPIQTNSNWDFQHPNDSRDNGWANQTGISQQSHQQFQQPQHQSQQQYESQIEHKVFNMLNKYLNNQPSPNASNNPSLNYLNQPPQHQAPPQQQQQNPQSRQRASSANSYYGGYSNSSYQHAPPSTSSKPQIIQQIELDEIKTTTMSLTKELSSMRKLIEDLHITGHEKDAEISQLKMNLGDERNKIQQMRHQASQSSLNRSMEMPRRSSNIEPQRECNCKQLEKKNKELKQDMDDVHQRHLNEVQILKEQIQRQAQESNELNQLHERTISSLKRDCKTMQTDVQKALKIHRANKELNGSNSFLKKEMERLKQEHKKNLESSRVQIETMDQQMEQMKQDYMNKAARNLIVRETAAPLNVVPQPQTVQQRQGPCKSCMTLQSDKEILTEDLDQANHEFTKQMNKHSEQISKLEIEKTKIELDLKNSLEKATNQQSASMQNNSAQSQQQIAALKAEFATEKAQLENKHSAVLTQIKENLSKQVKLCEERDAQIKALEKELTVIRQQVKEHIAECDTLTKKNQKAEKSIEAAATQMEHFATKSIMNMEVESSLRAEVAKKDKELKNSQLALEQMGSQFEQMMTSMSGGKR